jgi:hypothetical protein
MLCFRHQAVDAKRLAQLDWLTVWRAGTLKFELRAGAKANPPEGVILHHKVNVGAMVKGIDKAVERLRKG